MSQMGIISSHLRQLTSLQREHESLLWRLWRSNILTLWNRSKKHRATLTGIRSRFEPKIQLLHQKPLFRQWQKFLLYLLHRLLHEFHQVTRRWCQVRLEKRPEKWSKSCTVQSIRSYIRSSYLIDRSRSRLRCTTGWWWQRKWCGWLSRCRMRPHSAAWRDCWTGSWFAFRGKIAWSCLLHLSKNIPCSLAMPRSPPQRRIHSLSSSVGRRLPLPDQRFLCWRRLKRSLQAQGKWCSVQAVCGNASLESFKVTQELQFPRR